MNIGNESKAEDISGLLEVGNNIFDRCTVFWTYRVCDLTILKHRHALHCLPGKFLPSLKSLRLSPEL